MTGTKLDHGGFPLNVRKPFGPVRVPERWHGLPRGGCGVSSDTLKSHLYVVQTSRAVLIQPHPPAGQHHFPGRREDRAQPSLPQTEAGGFQVLSDPGRPPNLTSNFASSQLPRSSFTPSRAPMMWGLSTEEPRGSSVSGGL